MIDYQKLASAIAFYKQAGYSYIDVPWVVDADVALITTEENRLIKSDFGCLVGSAEQSFLQVIYSDLLPKGKYVACTPCFRPDVNTYLHKQYFMKVELIRTDKVDSDSLQEMINQCFHFYSVYVKCYIKETEEGFDIMSDEHIELGSYGIRSSPLVGEWIYGTGCAEPRLSAVHSLRRSINIER